MIEAVVKALPKIELHCHLDGSIRPETLREIAEAQGYEFPQDEKELVRLLQAPDRCEDLKDYLKRFDSVLDCLQVAPALEKAAYDVARQAAEENTIYLEIRYAPLLSTRKGLTGQEVVEAILQGMKRAETDFPIKTNLLLCGMRGHGMENNLQVVELARQYADKGVAAIDLAGDEYSYPPMEYEEMFAKTRDYGLSMTIHAGECGSSSNIRDSVALGTFRIGHGVAASKSPEVLQHCIDQEVLFEMCPTSNVQTGAVAEWKDFPLQQLLDAGMKISINTDNRTVSNTTLTREYMMLSKYCGLTYEDMKQLNWHAAAYAFLNEEEKKQLQAEIEQAYNKIAK